MFIKICADKGAKVKSAGLFFANKYTYVLRHNRRIATTAAATVLRKDDDEPSTATIREEYVNLINLHSATTSSACERRGTFESAESSERVRFY